MTFLSHIHKVKSNTFILSFLAILFLFTPGIAFIFFFNNSLFISLDFWKLLFLSLAFISPFILANLILTWHSNEDEKRDLNEEYQFYSLLMSIFISNLIVYLCLFVAFFFKFDLWATCKLFPLVEIILIAGISIETKVRNKKKYSTIQ